MLRAELWPSEPWPWYTLADLYDGLIEAYESLDWYEAEASRFQVSLKRCFNEVVVVACCVVLYDHEAPRKRDRGTSGILVLSSEPIPKSGVNSWFR